MEKYMQRIRGNRTNSIDIFKMFFCICIISLHTEFLKYIDIDAKISWIIEHWIFRMAVPFFFVTSGYFLAGKMDSTLGLVKAIKSYCSRLIKPLLFFESINFLLPLVFMLDSKFLEKIITYIKSIIPQVIFYPPGALWYVQASIIGAIIIGILLKFFSKRVVLIIGIIAYVFALICNNYYFVIDGTIVRSFVDLYLSQCISARNGFFVGFPFLFVGVYMRCANFGIFRHKACQIITPIFFMAETVIVFIMSNGIFVDDGSLYFSQLLMAPLLLYWSMHIRGLNNEKSLIIRNLSTGMYFVHRIVLYSLNVILTVGGVDCFRWVLFPSTVVISALLCAIAYNQPIAWIKNMFK